MSRHVPLLLTLLAFVAGVGCGKTASTTSSGDAQPVEEAPKSRFRGDSRAFVDQLVALGISGWAVADDGAAVLYEQADFAEDGTFRATVNILLGSEPFACTESGTWTLDGQTSTSATVGNVNFEMSSTDCAGRQAPLSWRAQLTVEDNDITAEMR